MSCCPQLFNTSTIRRVHQFELHGHSQMVSSYSETTTWSRKILSRMLQASPDEFRNRNRTKRSICNLAWHTPAIAVHAAACARRLDLRLFKQSQHICSIQQFPQSAPKIRAAHGSRFNQKSPSGLLQHQLVCEAVISTS